jgi:hypothetical protein
LELPYRQPPFLVCVCVFCEFYVLLTFLFVLKIAVMTSNGCECIGGLLPTTTTGSHFLVRADLSFPFLVCSNEGCRSCHSFCAYRCTQDPWIYSILSWWMNMSLQCMNWSLIFSILSVCLYLCAHVK